MSSLKNNQSRVLKNGDAEPPLAAGAARIYSMRFCPYAERVLLYAAAKNILVEVVNIDLRNKPSWYLEKNPLGKVPAFEKDGKVVVESGIIPEYLDAIYPQSSILPSDPFLRAQQRIIAEQLGALAPAFIALVGVLKANAEETAKEEKVTALLANVDAAEKLLTAEFFGGSSAGYADWMCFPFFKRLEAVSTLPIFDGIDSTAFPGAGRWPKLTAWYDKISASPAVKEAVQSIDAMAEFMKNMIYGQPDYDYGF